MNELRDTRRYARIRESAEQFGGAAGRFLWRSGNDSATRCKRRGDLLRHEVDREIPGRECCNRANRLVDDTAEVASGADERSAIVALCVFGRPVEQLGG